MHRGGGLGAMFGDNLSMISDTTIAACSTQGTEMKDKFRANFKIALPAALAALALIIVVSLGTDVQSAVSRWSRSGAHHPLCAGAYRRHHRSDVFVVLLIGIAAGAAITLITGQVTALELMGNMGGGVSGMFETILVTLLVASLCGLIRAYGGFESILASSAGCSAASGAASWASACWWVSWISPLQQHRGHRHGRPHRQGGGGGVRHQPQALRLPAGHLLLHLSGHHPLRRQMLVAISTCATLGYAISAFDIIPLLFYPFLLCLSSLLFILFDKK